MAFGMVEFIGKGLGGFVMGEESIAALLSVCGEERKLGSTDFDDNYGYAEKRVPCSDIGSGYEMVIEEQFEFGHNREDADDRLRRVRSKIAQDIEWFRSNYEQLRKAYGKGYVAVLQCQVLGYHRNREALLKKFYRQYGERSVYIGCLASEKPPVVGEGLIHGTRPE